MRLDYVAETGSYVLQVTRREGADIPALMAEHGLDLSTSASTTGEAVLFTREPYAAVSFADCATPRAKALLTPLAAEIALSLADNSGAHLRVPADKELWPFQAAAVEYALRHDGMVLLGDEPGLGKTEEAIVFANETGASHNLVICPASIRLQWAARIREWSTLPWPSIIHTILSSRNGVHPTAAWNIVSYDLARIPSIWKALAMHGPYDLVVLDEAHYLKSVDAGRTRAIFGGGDNPKAPPIAAGARHILGLSGTPMPNRPRECYTLCRALNFDAIDWMSEEKFKHRFNPTRVITGTRRDGSEYRFNDEREGRHAELQNRLRANLMTRHLKRAVMPQLQMPVYDLVHVEETAAVKRALHAESLLAIDPEQLEGSEIEVLGHISEVRRLMGVALAPQVVDYVEMLLDGGEEKLVVFGWHIEVLDILERGLQKHGVVRVDGSTSAKMKSHLVEQFQRNPKIQVIIGNLLSLGTGTDGLQNVSCHALIAEPDWVPGTNVQAFDRLDRGGQTRQVQGDIFVAPGSFAEKILASALRKQRTTHAALDKRATVS